MSGSEFGGVGGIIQPDIDGVDPEAAAVGLGHASDENRAADRRGVRDAAMVVRHAGLAEARGRVVETVVDPETGVASFVQYDEAASRAELTTGDSEGRG